MYEDYSINITKTDSVNFENVSSFLQSSLWGEFKSRFGWDAKTFLIELSKEEQSTFYLHVLCRRLAPGFSFAYIPWGPCFTPDFPLAQRQKAMALIAVKLKPFLFRNTVFIRFEPPWFLTDDDQKDQFVKAGFKQAASVVQPPDTVIINLKNSCEEILAAMKPKWRYNISLAEKKGVQVKKGGIEDIEIFYDLLKETAIRDGISVHGINYYKTLFEICEKYKKEGDLISLYTASHENETIAAVVVLFFGKEAVYLYGASSANKRNLMAPYALQWKAMRDAKEAGCETYDLFGIPPNEDPNHPMAGLYRFKTGFGGKIIHRPGTWDYIYKNVFYYLFKAAEKMRKRKFDKKKIRK